MESNASNEKLINLQHQVCIIGWLGAIFSSLIMTFTAIALQMHHEVVEYLLEMLPQLKDTYELRREWTKVVVQFCSICYGLAVINILVCSVLLIGVTKRSASFLVPWLIYNGTLFGACIYLILYFVSCGMIRNLEYFFYAFIMLTLLLVLFCKAFHDVLMLYKTLQITCNGMQQNEKQLAHNMEVANRILPVHII